MRQEKVPQGIGHGPALAAADVVGRGNWPFYRFERLSNRALAAIGGKCRCGPLGRRDIKIYRKCKVLFPYSTREKSFCVERGSGSGSCRRVPEPVIARHPRGAWERQRGETYKRFDAEPFCTVVGIGQGKSKNRRFLAAFFSIFLSLLKEIWPPEAEMQDAGAARNQRTRNGPSRTPAPTKG